MSARVGRAPGGHPGPGEVRARAAVRKRPTGAAGKPGRRSSEERHDHELTRPTRTNSSGAAVPGAGSVRGRPRSARSPDPQAAPVVPRTLPAAVRAAPRSSPPRPSATGNRPEWDTSPPPIPRRTSSGLQNKPTNAGRPAAKRDSPAKTSVSSKQTSPEKHGIPKRTGVGSSARASNKPDDDTAPKSVRKASTNGRRDSARAVTAKKSAKRGVGNGTGNPRGHRSVQEDRPRSGSTTGEVKGEPIKVLEKSQLEETNASSDEELGNEKLEAPVRFSNTWRTGDGDDNKMNALRTKPRTNEPRISPSWNFEDLIIEKKPEKNDRSDRPKRKNRFSFLVDSTDDDEPDAAPHNDASREKDFSLFDGFLRESLSPDRNKSSKSLPRDKPDPVSEKLLRPSTAARIGSAPSHDSRSRSGSRDHDPPKGTGTDRGPAMAGHLDNIIQPKSPDRGTSSSPSRERRVTVPQMERNSKPKTNKPRVPPKLKPSASETPRRSPSNNRTHHSNTRTPSPEKGDERRKQGRTSGKENHQKSASAPNREESLRSPQDLKLSHQRRSRTPSPDTEDTFERYHDVYPDENETRFSTPGKHRRESPIYVRKNRSPSPISQQVPRPSYQNGTGKPFSEVPKSDYFSPKTAVELRERRGDQKGEKKVKRKSLSLAGMSNPERTIADDEGAMLRRLIVSTEALERRLFSP